MDNQLTSNTPATSSPSRRVRLGTRASALARWQADWVADQLRQRNIEVELVLIRTQGDISQQPLNAAGGQGLFTKEIQRALLEGRVDLAVHSLKDLPTEPVPGLTLAAVPPRESPRDAFLSHQVRAFDELPAGAKVGTGSRRRQSQLLHQRADLRVAEIRGNVDSRLRKLDDGEYDAIILAEAGLIRLGLSHRITQLFSTEVMLPAVGQGALGLEIRSDDLETEKAVQSLDDSASHAAVLAERAMLAELRGGCLAPIGAWGRVDQAELWLSGVVLSENGRRRLFITLRGSVSDPLSLGRQVAGELRKLGADELIAAARK